MSVKHADIKILSKRNNESDLNEKKDSKTRIRVLNKKTDEQEKILKDKTVKRFKINDTEKKELKNSKLKKHKIQKNKIRNKTNEISNKIFKNKKDISKNSKFKKLNNNSNKEIKRINYESKNNFMIKDQSITKINYDKTMEKSLKNITSVEKEILKRGTIKNKIDLLTLLITQNRGNNKENLQKLFEFCENERHSIILYVIKNFKDLLISNKNLFQQNTEYSNKFFKILEKGLKNEFISNSIIKIVYDLLTNEIHVDGLIKIFVNKIGGKKIVSHFVCYKLTELVKMNKNKENRNKILNEIYEYFSRDTVLKARVKILKIIRNLKFDEQEGIIIRKILNIIFSEISTYKTEKSELLSCYINMGIEIYEKIEKDFENSDLEDDFILEISLSNCNSIKNLIHILYKTKSKKLGEYFTMVFRNNIINNYEKVPEILNILLNFLLNENDIKIRKKVMINSLKYIVMNGDIRMILSILIILAVIVEKFGNEILYDNFAIQVLSRHYYKPIQYLFCKIMNTERIEIFDPYDEFSLKNTENIIFSINKVFY
ncbi:hypothetical protein CWI39_0639p0020 [Hamiltosporidium magnivora]|uniref:Uncharacterized protein n=1 Tax=Hamiltosporidium magnivora TaxID=148818 RepID=A0A4Q9LCQ8_9MICR|nr:hypothetical protein CWI39_0639p0020 [Hamiltosporidium magnivora]